MADGAKVSFVDKLKQKIANRAGNNLPFIFSLLRFFWPILVFKKFALITRFADVQEVLSRPDAFGVTYAEKMAVITDGSNFFLGMENTPRYTQDVSNMRIVFPRDDLADKIPSLISAKADEIVGNCTGEMEIVSELAGIVPAHFVQDYIGLKNINFEDLIEWTTTMFQYLFFSDNPKDVDEKAGSHAAQTRKSIDHLVTSRKETASGAQDMVQRCLDLQTSGTPGMTDVDIRNNIIGIIIGLVPTTSKCVALVLDYLLDHPTQLHMAQLAARRDNDELIKKIVLETLRFNSFGAGVFRVSNEDYSVAKGTFRCKKIPKGCRILVATQSAMLDGHELKKPESFSLDRPDYQYMHFGYGMHTCFGEYLNLVQIPLILKPLLKCKNLRRAKGDAGKMKLRGPFPIRLSVEFN